MYANRKHTQKSYFSNEIFSQIVLYYLPGNVDSKGSLLNPAHVLVNSFFPTKKIILLIKTIK